MSSSENPRKPKTLTQYAFIDISDSVLASDATLPVSGGNSGTAGGPPTTGSSGNGSIGSSGQLGGGNGGPKVDIKGNKK